MGPDKLPKWRTASDRVGAPSKRIQERVESEVRDAIPDLPSTGDIARIVRSPINLLNQLSDQVDAKRGRRGAEERAPAARDGGSPAHHPAQSTRCRANREFDAAA